ncbi:MAG TPA: response regulator transcription factor [Mesorhizobium sp.]|nr:response regulator transcription factor [Mesorhizobium sp.]
MRARIAVVEDEPDLRDAVVEYLQASGFDATGVADAAAMRRLSAETRFDAAILDIAMPGEDGLSLGRWLRAQSPMGLIYATAAGASIDRIVGLELGADDYLVKPYELRELLARVRSVLRRMPPAEAVLPSGLSRGEPKSRRVARFGGFHVDLDGRILSGPGGEVDLSKSEFDLLELFLERPNRVLSRASLAAALGHDDDADEHSRALDLRVMRLRRKIEADPAHPVFLRTARGEGYVFVLAEGG